LMKVAERQREKRVSTFSLENRFRSSISFCLQHTIAMSAESTRPDQTEVNAPINDPEHHHHRLETLLSSISAGCSEADANFLKETFHKMQEAENSRDEVEAHIKEMKVTAKRLRSERNDAIDDLSKSEIRASNLQAQLNHTEFALRYARTQANASAGSLEYANKARQELSDQIEEVIASQKRSVSDADSDDDFQAGPNDANYLDNDA